MLFSTPDRSELSGTVPELDLYLPMWTLDRGVYVLVQPLPISQYMSLEPEMSSCLHLFLYVLIPCVSRCLVYLPSLHYLSISSIFFTTSMP